MSTERIKAAASQLRWLSAAAAVLLMVTVACSTLPSTEDVRADIERHIQPGASLAQIEAYMELDAKFDFIYTGEIQRAGLYGPPLGDHISPDTSVVVAILGGRGSGEALRAIFVLDDDLRFQELVIRRSSNVI